MKHPQFLNHSFLEGPFIVNKVLIILTFSIYASSWNFPRKSPWVNILSNTQYWGIAESFAMTQLTGWQPAAKWLKYTNWTVTKLCMKMKIDFFMFYSIRGSCYNIAWSFCKQRCLTRALWGRVPEGWAYPEWLKILYTSMTVSVTTPTQNQT